MPWFLHDKLKCYRFCNEYGILTAEVLREFSSPDEIDLSNLNEPFVLKPTLQSSMKGVMVLEPLTDGYYDELRKRKLSSQDIVDEQTRLFHETKAAGKRIIAERKISDVDGYSIPLDYKVYAFNGRVALVLIVNRNTNPSTVSWFDGSFDPVVDGQVSYQETFKHHVEGSKPANAQEILETARKASLRVGTPFARIDMYATSRGVILGEITLVPGGLYYSHHYFLSDEQQSLMGEYWESALRELGREKEVLSE